MANLRNNPFVDLTERVSKTLQQYVQRGDRLVAALSGGLDSVVLLHLLCTLRIEHQFHLSALHVNHLLSPHAHQWASFCGELCTDWNVPLTVHQVEVEKMASDGPEAAARRARYVAFSSIDADWLVLAHHCDDQAETVLFNLLRGGGVSGAAAMPKVRGFSINTQLRVLRPLLDVLRSDIQSTADAQELTWIEDESNEDNRYTRNFIRQKVFPVLREKFPSCETVLARAAGHFSESESLLEQLAALDAQGTTSSGRIVCAAFAKLSEERARNLLRYVLKQAQVKMPDSVHLNEMGRQIRQVTSESHVMFSLGEKELHCFRGEVWIVATSKPVAEKLVWQGQSALQWGNTEISFQNVTGRGINQKKLLSDPVIIITRSGGEHIQVDIKRPRRSLKKLLQEHHVPPWQRDSIPLLWCGEDLVWVPGIGINVAYQCHPQENGLSVSWERVNPQGVA